MKSETLILLQFINFLLNLKFKIPYKSKMNCELCYIHKDVVYTQKCFPKVNFATIQRSGEPTRESIKLICPPPSSPQTSDKSSSLQK